MYKIMIRNQLTNFHNPTVETGLRVCSWSHSTDSHTHNDKIMIIKKYIFFFFKTKNCAEMILSLVAMIGLEKCCITSAYLHWLFHSGERGVACGPLVFSYSYRGKASNVFSSETTGPIKATFNMEPQWVGGTSGSYDQDSHHARLW